MDVSRVPRSKSAARDSYDRMSKWYDLLASPFEKKFVNLGLQKLQAVPGDIILEVGFGKGSGILELAGSVGNSGRVYGIDISEGMCAITRGKVEKAGFSGRVQLVCGDAANLPFHGESFDAIFMSFTLELFDTPEIPIVLQECKRALRKGGRLCVVAMKQKPDLTAMMKLYEWAHEKFPEYIDCRPIFVREMLEKAGFRILDAIEISSFGLPVEVVISREV